MDVRSALRAARARAGLSQAALAARTGTSQATVSAYERGRKQPSVQTFSRLLAAAGAGLKVEPRSWLVVEPTAAQHARVNRSLMDVLALAAALPTHHRAELRFPRLSSPSR